jgi:hypothetical protein
VSQLRRSQYENNAQYPEGKDPIQEPESTLHKYQNLLYTPSPSKANKSKKYKTMFCTDERPRLITFVGPPWY